MLSGSIREPVAIFACKRTSDKGRGTSSSFLEASWLAAGLAHHPVGPGRLGMDRHIRKPQPSGGRSRGPRARSAGRPDGSPDGGSCSLPHTPPQRMCLICCWQRDKQHRGPANWEAKRANQDDQERPQGGTGRGRWLTCPSTRLTPQWMLFSAQIWTKRDTVNTAQDPTRNEQ